jgi:hypothetical protein
MSNPDLTETERRDGLSKVDAQVRVAANEERISNHRQRLGSEIERLLTEAGLPLDTTIPEVGEVFSEWQAAKTVDEMAGVVLKVGNVLTARNAIAVKELRAELETEKKRGNQEEGIMNMGTGAKGASVSITADNIDAQHLVGNVPDDKYRKFLKTGTL